MPAFVIKVTLQNGDLLPPITAKASDEAAAVALVRSCEIAGPDDKVESKGPLRDDVMKRAFGRQPIGTVVTREDWIWSGEVPTQKSS
jgi:hypothetical protein